MERCDFCSVMAIIRRYISDDRNMSQTDLLYELFASFFLTRKRHRTFIWITAWSAAG